MSDGKVHSHIGASGMHRWAECPGSVRLCKDIPPTSSVYAEEGTKAHELAADILVSVLKTGGYPYPITDEMREPVSVYVDYVFEVWDKAKAHPDSWILIEHSFDLSKLHSGLFGTADTVIYDGFTKTLHVIDYKHGAGVFVDVNDNPQLKYYGLGALVSTGSLAKTVRITIVQPRCNADQMIRSQDIPAIDMLDFAADLVKAAKRTEEPDAPLNPGDHCHFCPASGLCPALHGKALAVAQSEFSPALSYNPEKLSEALSQLDVVEAWVKGVRDFAYNEAVHGRCPPGYKLVEKRATRKWIESEGLPESIMATLKLTKDQIYDLSLKTPPQIEKLLSGDKKLKEKLNSDFVVKSSSGTVLVKDSDPRPSLQSSAVEDFKPSIFE